MKLGMGNRFGETNLNRFGKKKRFSEPVRQKKTGSVNRFRKKTGSVNRFKTGLSIFLL